jgi:phage terminase small subunit
VADIVIKNTQAIAESLPHGPAMSKLSPQRQRFVLELLADDTNNGTAAAIRAGYAPENRNSAKEIASRLRHDPDVLAAIGEVARAQVWSLRALAASTVQQVLEDTTAAPRDRLRAAAMVMDRTDMPATSEQHVTVEHKSMSRAEEINAVIRLAKQLGQDPRVLLGSYGVTIDAEFKEVEAPERGTRDGLERSDTLPPIPGLEDVT